MSGQVRNLNGTLNRNQGESACAQQSSVGTLGLDMTTDLKETYQYLVARPGRKHQLYIKGRGCLTARDVVGTMMSNNLTPEQTADAYDLPLEAVQEASDYYRQYKPLIDAEVRQERRTGGLE
jgi:uncharacterized protein (DUF433 family)